jgi:hypothetical protein
VADGFWKLFWDANPLDCGHIGDLLCPGVRKVP